jgi:chemotaxis protein histidine kinase CheA
MSDEPLNKKPQEEEVTQPPPSSEASETAGKPAGEDKPDEKPTSAGASRPSDAPARPGSALPVKEDMSEAQSTEPAEQPAPATPPGTSEAEDKEAKPAETQPAAKEKEAEEDDLETPELDAFFAEQAALGELELPPEDEDEDTGDESKPAPPASPAAPTAARTDAPERERSTVELSEEERTSLAERARQPVQSPPPSPAPSSPSEAAPAGAVAQAEFAPFKTVAAWFRRQPGWVRAEISLLGMTLAIAVIGSAAGLLPVVDSVLGYIPIWLGVNLVYIPVTIALSIVDYFEDRLEDREEKRPARQSRRSAAASLDDILAQSSQSEPGKPAPERGWRLLRKHWRAIVLGWVSTGPLVTTILINLEVIDVQDAGDAFFELMQLTVAYYLGGMVTTVVVLIITTLATLFVGLMTILIRFTGRVRRRQAAQQARKEAHQVDKDAHAPTVVERSEGTDKAS